MNKDHAPSLEVLTGLVGRELGLSAWRKIDQNLVDLFATCTGDDQWIHVDVDRARKGPFGATIAHGWLVASLLAPWTLDALAQTVGTSRAVTYGVDKLRFVTPVHCGSWVRARLVLDSVQAQGEREALLGMGCTVEVHGEPKPALVATTLTLLEVT